MLTDVGEYLVGAYLQLVLKCDVVDYNVRPPGGGLEGLGELDVVGLKLESKQAYLCEVTTHIRGLNYGSNAITVQRVKDKHRRQKEYGEKYLRGFRCEYMFWSPVVPTGIITDALKQMGDLQLVINDEYTRRIEKLRELAKDKTHDARNPVFRMLQILAHLR